jgi:hypothetical protein
MAQQSHGDGYVGGKAQTYQERGNDGRRHTKSRCALQEGAKYPRQQQCLSRPVRGQARQLPPDHFDGSAVVDHVVQQQGHPDDIEDV